MLKIRLRRMGKRHRPFYRVVVSDSRSVPAAPAVDEIGHYDPMARPPRVRIDLERVEHWSGQGAQLSPAVRKLVKGVRTGRHEKAAEERPKKAAAPKAEAPAEEAAPTLSEMAEEPKSEAVAETAGASDESAAASEVEAEATPPPASEEAEVKAEAAAEPAEEPAEEAEAAAAETPAESSEEEPEPEKKGAAKKEDATDQ